MKIPIQFNKSPKDASANLRLEIIKMARFHPEYIHKPYHIEFEGLVFVSHDTSELVDQILLWLQRSPKEREEIKKGLFEDSED